MTFANDNLSGNFMTREQILEKAPYIGYETPTNPKVSNRYLMATTNTIIDDLDKFGWKVVDCKQQSHRKGRKNTTPIASFHMVCFQNPNLVIRKTDDEGNVTDECYPRIILTNSHDGMRSFKFMIGLFRCVCSNGLVVASEKFEDISIKHINYTIEQLQEVIAKAVNSVTEQIESINIMREVKLNDKQKKQFIIEALNIKIDNDKRKIVDLSEDDYEVISAPVREEDNGNDLWSVMNVVQEKLIKPQMYSLTNSKGKKRQQRGITGLAKNLDFNTRLWKLAMKTAEEAVVVA